MSSKWCCVLAVVCLSVMLLSLDADAQPTVDDDSSQCGSASLQYVAYMVRVIASNQQAMMDETKEIKDEMEEMKDKMEEMKDKIQEMKDKMEEMKDKIQEMKDDMEEMKDKIQEMKDEMKNETDRVRAEMEVVKRLVASQKQQLVSALVCEYVV